jgi:predicted nucleic-acid-binding protein
LIALDTNILARFYVEDPSDSESLKQRPLARRLIASSTQLFVPLSVVLELEWVLRAFYRFEVKDFVNIVENLLGLPNVSIEDWSRVVDALAWHSKGLDFADALHLAASTDCTEFASFDDRGFARRAQKLGLSPPVKLLGP